MAEPAWKRTERAIATRLGGQRVPVTGRGRGDVPDIAHTRLSIEVKHRQSLPKWLLDALRQARATARNGQMSIVVLHEHGARHGDDLVVLRLSDFEDLLGPWAALPSRLHASGRQAIQSINWTKSVAGRRANRPACGWA